jgi:hypothetical protein
MVTQIRHETHEQALARLLGVARESGVKLLHDDVGDYFATSVSEPTLLHRVSPDGCSCRGYLFHGRCRHLAALLAHLGQLDPNPEPPATVCPQCHGTGVLEVVHHARWVGGSRLGYRDQWSTPVVCLDCDGGGHREDDAEHRDQLWEVAGLIAA